MTEVVAGPAPGPSERCSQVSPGPRTKTSVPGTGDSARASAISGGVMTSALRGQLSGCRKQSMRTKRPNRGNEICDVVRSAEQCQVGGVVRAVAIRVALGPGMALGHEVRRAEASSQPFEVSGADLAIVEVEHHGIVVGHDERAVVESVLERGDLETGSELEGGAVADLGDGREAQPGQLLGHDVVAEVRDQDMARLVDPAQAGVVEVVEMMMAEVQVAGG